MVQCMRAVFNNRTPIKNEQTIPVVVPVVQSSVSFVLYERDRAKFWVPREIITCITNYADSATRFYIVNY